MYMQNVRIQVIPPNRIYWTRGPGSSDPSIAGALQGYIHTLYHNNLQLMCTDATFLIEKLMYGDVATS